MADKRVTDFTQAATVADDDILYVVDVSDTTDSAAGTSKKVTVDSVRESTALFYAKTAAETSAGVTIVASQYPPGNVLRYGQNTTPGTTDMTTAFTSARDSVDAGESIYVPYGIYSIGALDMGRRGIVGQGLGRHGRYAKDDAAWATNNGTVGVSGTVLRSTVASGTAINFGTVIGEWVCSRVSGFALIGEASNTAVGIYYKYWLSGATRDVVVGNFGTGMEITTCQDNLWDSIGCHGCTIGLTITGVANQNTFINTELNGNASALVATAGTQNAFYGGLVQLTTLDGIVLTGGGDGARGYVFDGFWYENTTMTGDLIRIDGTDSLDHRFSNSWIDNSTTHTISVENTGSLDTHIFDHLFGMNLTTITLNASVSNCIIRSCGGTFVDNGADNQVEQYGTPERTPVGTTAQLSAVGGFINTQPAKVAGAMVFDTTANIPMYATGSAAGDTWVGEKAGSTVTVTPA